MKTDQLLILEHKEIIPLKIERMTVYLRSKIVEAFNEDQEAYYLFFYKNTFLTGIKATRIRRHSFIEHSIKKGISFQYPHPIINKVITSDHPYKIQSLNHLIKRLQNQFTPHETAFILTFFESFVSRKLLFTHIQDIFYQYRRNGQMYACYQILRILMDFTPKNSFVKQMANDMSFIKYAQLYHKFSEELLEKDVIAAEKMLVSQKEDPNCFNRLEASLRKDGCLIDIVALHLEQFLSDPVLENYQALLLQLNSYFNEEELANILTDLSSKVPQFRPLEDDLLEVLLHAGKFEEATRLMTERKITPISLQPDMYKDLIEIIESSPDTLHYEKLNTFLIPLAMTDPEKAERILQQCVAALFKQYDIPYIKEWLAPIKAEQPSLAILKTIDRIEELTDDPNNQQVLGELYFDLMQYDRAIDCFSWEMELNASDRKPVEWLAKTYHKIGLDSEYEAYKQLLVEGSLFEEQASSAEGTQ